MLQAFISTAGFKIFFLASLIYAVKRNKRQFQTIGINIYGDDGRTARHIGPITALNPTDPTPKMAIDEPASA